jgi:hypothetical protein
VANDESQFNLQAAVTKRRVVSSSGLAVFSQSADEIHGRVWLDFNISDSPSELERSE